MNDPSQQLALPLVEQPSVEKSARPPKRKRVAKAAAEPVASGRSETQRDTTPILDPARLPENAPVLLTTGEAANVLRLHPRSVQRLVARGELTAIHLGAAVRFDAADVAELTRRLKQPAPVTIRAVPTESVKPTRPVRVSFADRLRPQR